VATNFVTQVAIVPLKRNQFHVDEVKDWPTQQSLRLLWDRVYQLQEQLNAAQATITTLLAATNQVNATSTDALQTAKHALVTAGEAVRAPNEPDPGVDCPDDGQADAGVAAAPATGHPGAAVPLTAFEAGKIVGGTGNEHPLLLAPTPDLATREANAEEMLERMIWHLQLAGFNAGRQRNPSSLISKDKLTVDTDGETKAYDVFIGLSEFTQAMGVHMARVCPADYVATGGTPD
jgi:hypothetical protein